MPERSRQREARVGSAAVGSGAVLAAAGAAGGGIPGTTSRSESLGQFRRTRKPADLYRAGRGGVFGYRRAAHEEFLNRQLVGDIAHERKGTTVLNHFLRGQGTGKTQPERDIIRHMKAGRAMSYGALGGGLGLVAYGRRRGRTEGRDRPSALLAGGATTAAGGYGVGRALDAQGRKWSERSAEEIENARRVVPGLGGSYRTPTSHNVRRVRPDLSEDQVREKAKSIFRNVNTAQAERAGRYRGAASQYGYFGNVYGKYGAHARRYAVPAGVAVMALGAGDRLLRRERKVTKSWEVSKAKVPRDMQEQYNSWSREEQAAWHRAQNQERSRSNAGGQQHKPTQAQQSRQMRERKLVEDTLAAERGKHRPTIFSHLADAHISRGKSLAGLGAVVTGAGVTSHLRHRNDARQRRAAVQVPAAAALGAGGAYGGYVGGSYGLSGVAGYMGRGHKADLSEHVRSHVGTYQRPGNIKAGSPEAATHYRAWRQKVIPKFDEAYATTPLHIPGAGLRRFGAATYGAGRFGRHKGKVLGTGAVVGGAWGLGRSIPSRRVSKGDWDTIFAPADVKGAAQTAQRVQMFGSQQPRKPRRTMNLPPLPEPPPPAKPTEPIKPTQPTRPTKPTRPSRPPRLGTRGKVAVAAVGSGALGGGGGYLVGRRRRTVSKASKELVPTGRRGMYYAEETPPRRSIWEYVIPSARREAEAREAKIRLKNAGYRSEWSSQTYPRGHPLREKYEQERTAAKDAYDRARQNVAGVQRPFHEENKRVAPWARKDYESAREYSRHVEAAAKPHGFGLQTPNEDPMVTATRTARERAAAGRKVFTEHRTTPGREYWRAVRGVKRANVGLATAAAGGALATYGHHKAQKLKPQQRKKNAERTANLAGLTATGGTAASMLGGAEHAMRALSVKTMMHRSVPVQTQRMTLRSGRSIDLPGLDMVDYEHPHSAIGSGLRTAERLRRAKMGVGAGTAALGVGTLASMRASRRNRFSHGASTGRRVS